MVVMVAMEPFKVLSMMVYLAFESVGMLNVVADTALNDISAKNANKAFFISLSPLVGFGQISRDISGFNATKSKKPHRSEVVSVLNRPSQI